MVQVIQPRDIGGEIGQAVGGGLGRAAEMGAQRMMVGDALEKALEQSKEGGQSPYETLIALSKSFAGVPGGMQMIGEIFPTLRQEMIRQSKAGGMPAAAGAVTDAGQVPPTEQTRDTRSVEQKVRSRTQENMLAGMDYDKALAASQAEIGLETSQQAQQQTRQAFNREFFEKSYAEAFPKNDLDSSLVALMRSDYEDKIAAGVTPEKAWAPLMQEYRAAQIEIGKMAEQAGRNWWVSIGDAPDEAIKAMADTAPTLRRLDPDLHRQKMIEQGFGEGEASLGTKPGSEKFKSFRQSFRKGWAPGMERMSMADLGPMRAKQEKKLTEYLKKEFDTENDSLLALRHVAFDGGVGDKRFLEIVNEVYPDPVNNKELSAFNRREVPRLSQAAVPGLMEIFRGLFREVYTPVERFMGLTRGKR